MAYTAIGYKTKSPIQVLLPAAKLLLGTFSARGIYETCFAEAFRNAFTDKRPVRTLDAQDILLLSGDPNFGIKSPEFKAFAHIVYAMMKAGGFGDYCPPVLYYREDPVMTVDEMINEALNSELVLPGADHYDGERTTCEVFRSSIANVITNICILEQRRVHFLDIFKRYMGNLLYTLRTQPSFKVTDQWDRSALAVYFAEKNGTYRTTTIGVQSPTIITYPIAPDNDPEIGPIMAKLKAVCQPGPWLRYTRMLSTQDIRELAIIQSPVVPNLPMSTGYELERGPFTELRLEQTENITWGDKEQFAGFMEQVTYLQNPTHQLVTTGYRPPAYVLSKAAFQVHGFFDFPFVGIELRDDATALPHHQGLKVVYSWHSYIHRRRVSTITGASFATFMYDLGAQTGSAGETHYEKLNVDQFDYVDLSDPTVQARKFVYGTGVHIIKAPIFYMEGGRLWRREVDMTLFYNKLGNVGYKPALVEFMAPSREWFQAPAPNAVDFIVGRLGLNTYDALASKKLINLSHNVALFVRLTGRQPNWSLEQYIEATTGKSIEKTLLPAR